MLLTYRNTIALFKANFTLNNVKDYKVKMFHPRMGQGRGDFFFGLAALSSLYFI
jgi:hypothetical protein